MTTLKDRRIIGDLFETYKVMSSIDWVKPLNLRINEDISGPATKLN